MVDLPDEVKNMDLRQPEAPREERRAPRGEWRERGDRGDRGDRGEGGFGGDKMGGRGFGPGRKRRRLFWSGKVCPCCMKKMKYVDYKEIDVIRRFVSTEGRILPRRLSGACAHHQRMITSAVKRARNIALLPYTTK